LIITKQNFINSYSSLSISNYILGIGDRHLENFLYNRKDGWIISIDFGVSFNNWIFLPIPELV